MKIDLSFCFAPRQVQVFISVAEVSKNVYKGHLQTEIKLIFCFLTGKGFAKCTHPQTLGTKQSCSVSCLYIH